MFEKVSIEQSIPDRFEQQAVRHADRPAVKTRSHALSYRDLNAFANRIAHRILEGRGGEAEPVALLLEQDAPLIAAILGVLKAGKFYVPLDPVYPKASIARMLRHSGAKLIVADGCNLGLADELSGGAASVLSVDGIEPGSPAGNPGLSISPDHLAYIFYTSGSTGQPKGVADNHRNVLHNIMRYTNGLAIGPEDRLTLLQSASFSGSVSSLFSAVLNGAAVFPFDLKKESLAALSAWMIEQRITMYHSVPVLFRRVAPEGGYFPDVRVIRLEGDQAAPADAVLYRKHFAPECVLVNGLGATETGLTRRYFVDRNTEIAGGILPVGYPVEDMEVLLLDERGDPVECGQAGDIAVKSGYLAVGYWRNPELTNVRFRHCEGEDGLRTYLTGDLGRMRADGCLEHLGRRDFQVKIRGHRVDVAEVESALCGLEEVREAAVAAFDDTHGEKRLAAYLVPAGQRMPPAGALRRFVAERVPDYMIPSLFLTVASLPLNLNGKLDRAALPAPEPASSAARVEPRNAAEEALAGIWRAVLGLGEVGVRDDFFEAGGDSLLAASMFARIRRRFGKDLPVATILEAPTIERLARAVCEDGWAPGPSTLAPLQPNGSRPPFFCFHPADGQVLFYRGMARALGPDQPVYGLQAAGLDGREPPLVRVEEMAARYLREMREVQPQGPYRLGGHCLGVLLALEVAQQLQAQGERVGLLVSFDTDLLWQMVSSPREAVRYHLATLSRLSARGKLAYLAERARYNVARLAGTMAAKAGALYGALGRPLPAGLRGMVIRELNHQAGIRYVPRPYGGRLILFLDDAGAPRDRALFWETVAAGGVEVQSVPGRDAGIFSEPNVRVLAGKLRACLESCS